MKYLAVLGAIAGFALLVLLEMCLSSYVISVLWLWFIVATFNVAALSIPQSIGLALLVGYLTKQYQQNEKDEDAAEAIVRAIFLIILKASFALTVGWVVTLFM